MAARKAIGVDDLVMHMIMREYRDRMNAQEDGEPKRQRWKTFGKYLAALVLGGVVVLVVEYSVSLARPVPQPPKPVDFPLTVGSTGKNDPGAQSSVTVAPLEGAGARVNGTVTDTKDDGHGVKIELVPVDAQGVPQSPLVVVNYEGVGNSVGLGPGGARTDHDFHGDVKEISIRECVFDRQDEQRLHELQCGIRTVTFADRP